MTQDLGQSERVLNQLLREWLSKQKGGPQLLADFERDPEETALRLRAFLEQAGPTLPPTLATYVSGGQVEKLVNIAQAGTVHIHLSETSATITPEELQKHEHSYLRWVAGTCSTLETLGVDLVSPELTDVFVMLEAVESPRKEPVDIIPLPERVEEMGLNEQLPAALAGLRETRRRESETERKERTPAKPPPPPVPLSRALEEHTHLVILGEPGTGKTTMLQFLALCFAKVELGLAEDELGLNETRVPVRVALREYDGAERLDRFLIRWLDRHYVPEALAQDWLTTGRLAILLDGLDEVPETHRKDVVDAIKDFATTPKGRGCRVVLTSRIAGYREVRGPESRGPESKEFGHYTIRPFLGSQDALRYTAGWLRVLRETTEEGAAKDEAEALLARMKEQGGSRRVMSNPLLLRLALTVYVDTNELAHSRAELYRRYVEEVVWKRAEAQQRPRWSHKQVAESLEALAWALQTQGERTTTALADVVQREVADVADGEELIDHLREHLGLLAIYGYERGKLITFRHLTFQEYFVAQQLARLWREDQERAWRFLCPRLHHSAWKEPVLLLVAVIGEKNGHGSFGRKKLLDKFSRTTGTFWANDQQKSLDLALKHRSGGRFPASKVIKDCGKCQGLFRSKQV